MKVIKKPVKNIKKVFYKGRLTKFKRMISLMLVGGILASALYFVSFAYSEYAVSRAHILLSYPEIAQSQYPDGSRFTYYDFVSDERLSEALEIMQQNGKYQTYTVDDIRDEFYVYSYLDASASSNVSQARSEGNDFSYVANEYRITFVQPHDYKNENFFKKFLTPDYSQDFLNVLVEVNKKYLAEEKSGINGFKTVTALGDMSEYDYDEMVKIYRTKINAVTAYLNTLARSSPKFKSDVHNMSLKDIKGRYDLLISNRLNSISDFINSSAISTNKQVKSNKIKVNLETNLLNYNMYVDEAAINKYAMDNYDHTFTENLINVVRDNKQGLYQARPKTAFDAVVDQMNLAREKVSQYADTIYTLNEDLARYEGVAHTAEEANRLSSKCDGLFAQLNEEYNSLTAIAIEVVSECLNETNEEYLVADVTTSSIFSVSLVAKMGVVFVMAALVVFVLCVLSSALADSAELKRKRKMLKQMKTTEKGA